MRIYVTPACCGVRHAPSRVRVTPLRRTPCAGEGTVQGTHRRAAHQQHKSEQQCVAGVAAHAARSSGRLRHGRAPRATALYPSVAHVRRADDHHILIAPNDILIARSPPRQVWHAAVFHFEAHPPAAGGSFRRRARPSTPPHHTLRRIPVCAHYRALYARRVRVRSPQTRLRRRA